MARRSVIRMLENARPTDVVTYVAEYVRVPVADYILLSVPLTANTTDATAEINYLILL